MSSTATAFLNKAVEQVGFREGRNNDNPYGKWYGMNNAPYCAIGLTWTAYQVGAEAQIGGKWAYCPYWADWFRRRGMWKTSNPKRGDIVFYDWSGQKRYGQEAHVGAVLGGVDTTHEKAIEYNTTSGTPGNQSDGGGVYVRTRSTLYVVGYGIVDWVPETNVVVVNTKPGVLPLVVDGVWGARTTKRLQQVLKVAQDGELGPISYRALATWLGQPASPTFTRGMKTALQHRVGVPADGVIGPITVKALQRYLNRI